MYFTIPSIHTNELFELLLNFLLTARKSRSIHYIVGCYLPQALYPNPYELGLLIFWLLWFPRDRTLTC